MNKACNMHIKFSALKVICDYLWAVSLTAAWLPQSPERKDMGSNPGWANTQGLKITEKKLLCL